MFVSHEVLTSACGFSFVPFSRAFSFLWLLATTILDSFFLFELRSNCQHSLDHRKSKRVQKSIYFCFIDYAKAFDSVDQHKLWKILKEMGIPNHPTSLLRNLYAGQEATVRTGHRITDWFQIGKGVCQGCMLSPCLFNFFAGYIMRNAGLDEAQAGIKTARRNINNLTYADDTTLMAEGEEELKSLLMKVKEESENVGLKFNSQKTKIMASNLISSWQIEGETVEQWLTLFF